ncbi:MAG: DMT family transporter, partial [Paeniglutamicibacter terrestris]
MSQSSTATETAPRSRAPIYLAIAVLAGLAMPIQSRINGALGLHLGDPIAASLVSFCTGLILLIIISLLVPWARAGAREIPRALREKRFPWWYLAA